MSPPGLRWRDRGATWRVSTVVGVSLLLVLAACRVPAPQATTRVESQPVAGGPTLVRNGIQLRRVAPVGGGSVSLKRNPADGQLYYLNTANGLFRVDPTGSGAPVNVAPRSFGADGDAAGMTFGPDGTLYVVFNKKVDPKRTQALVRRGRPNGAGGYVFETLATTEPYPLSGTPFDHLFNGVVVSPDGKWLYLNSGSRTDHGEIETNGLTFAETREAPLTSAILRVPTDALDLTLPADEVGLKPYLVADGTRNAYDLAFAPNGDLFATDNGPDADFNDELNWIREGRHYGFPWRFGSQDNPQQFPDYDRAQDKRLSMDFTAVKTGTYRNDPTFPKPPAGVTFTDPVANVGPDAASYRADDGAERNAAAEGKSLQTFTAHRSPLGLTFVSDPQAPAGIRSDNTSLGAFVLSWGAAGGTLADRGQDLLQLRLTRRGDNYEAVTTQVARGFKNPISAVMIENRLYVLEFGDGGSLWELTFE